MEKTDLIRLGLLWLCAAAALWLARRFDRRQDEQKRRMRLDADYPQIVGDLCLYTGAGIHAVNALVRMAAAYQKRVLCGGPVREGYEQIVWMCRRLKDGAGEADVFAALGDRCRTRFYYKLSLILSAGLRQGERKTAELLEKEETQALELRRRQAQKAGKDASVKLLLPLTILMAVLMILLIVPAMWGIVLEG